MKNKQKTYLLLLAVITIWGYISYSFISTFYKNNDIAPINTSISSKVQDNINHIDTFSLLLNYRDPFLGKESINKNTQATIKTNAIQSTNIKTEVKKAVKEWPLLKYVGLVNNQTGNKQLVLININGKLCKMHLNEELNEITVLKFNRDSVLVEFLGKGKYIKR